MSLPSPLEKLMSAVESNVKQTVESYASPQKFYRLNGECDNYKTNLDDFSINLLQVYANELQKSQERKLFDLKFDREKYEKRMDNIRNTGKKVASATAGIATFAGSVYLLDGSFDSAFHGVYMIGTMAGLGALWAESLLNPLGTLLTMQYRKSRLLGTEQYDVELKKNCYNKIRSHLKEINPENPIIRYHDDWTKFSKN
jgi:hypothetical protein